MDISTISYGADVYIYLKTEKGAIAEATAPSFLRALLACYLRLLAALLMGTNHPPEPPTCRSSLPRA
jgi:hypothetical protein